MYEKYSVHKLSEWWNKFNNWEYPLDFPFPKPEDWDNLRNYSYNLFEKTKYKISMPYIKEIEKIIGQKECLRYHHVYNMGYKNFLFEMWWFTNLLNGFIQKYINENFYFDIYDFLRIRGKDGKLEH